MGSGIMPPDPAMPEGKEQWAPGATNAGENRMDKGLGVKIETLDPNDSKIGAQVDTMFSATSAAHQPHVGAKAQMVVPDYSPDAQAGKLDGVPHQIQNSRDDIISSKNEAQQGFNVEKSDSVITEVREHGDALGKKIQEARKESRTNTETPTSHKDGTIITNKQ
jgi:hypothetical protein